MDTRTAHAVININVNSQHFQVHEEEMSGAALKQLAEIPPANLLFREVHGPGDDEQISDGTIVQLKSGDRFYDMPQGNFGRH